MKKPKLKFYFNNKWKFKYMDIYFLPIISINKLSWKDKYNFPRVDLCPGITINWLGLEFMWTSSDNEWEKYLWANKYSKSKDLQDWPLKNIKK